MESRTYPTGWIFISMRLAIFAALLLAASVAAHAENNCPWMNEATASDLVGGNAVGTYVADHGKAATCTFIEQTEGAARTLQISIESAGNPDGDYLLKLKANCHSTPTPLTAIGNEAAICPMQSSRKVTGEWALGRVRDQVFVIALSTQVRNDSVLTPAMLEMKVRAAAEQVAGSLY